MASVASRTELFRSRWTPENPGLYWVCLGEGPGVKAWLLRGTRAVGAKRRACYDRSGQVRKHVSRTLTRFLNGWRSGSVASHDVVLGWSVLKRPGKTHSP